ncbi:hypothetical protein BSZ08_03330 [Staphylococcus aureus]|nr:hypothetical protein BSZ08_03330 [Staphylococcus aureus]
MLYVGAPPQLAHYCKLTFRQLLCWGPIVISSFLTLSMAANITL